MLVFTFLDIIKSDTAKKHNIDNNIKTWEIIYDAEFAFKSLTSLFNKFKEEFNITREKFIITSWFRCNILNEIVNGKKYSDHKKAKAIDFFIVGITPKETCEFINKNCIKYDQLIQYPSWTHISFERIDYLNKNEYLIKKKQNYTKG